MNFCPNYEGYKDVWEKCLSLCYEYIQKGISKQAEIINFISNIQISKEEFCINSRYLHRGFYCPSPDLEHIVTNMRRGKIAKRITKVSRVTNRYLFDTGNRLRLAETFYPNGSTDTEYIFYEDNVTYGLTFDSYGHISKISIENNMYGRIISYLWAHCLYRASNDSYHVSWMMYETYCYDNKGYLDTEFYDMLALENNIIRYYKYRFSLDEDGMVRAQAEEQGENVTVLLSHPKDKESL